MSNSNTEVAIRSYIDFGTIKSEGYRLPEKLWTATNKFAISKTQVVLLAYPDLDRNYGASRYTEITKSNKAQIVAPHGFFVHRKVKVEGLNERVDLLPADYIIPFLKVCKKLGSVAADELIDNLAGLSIQQLFSDAFDIEFGKRDRQEWMAERQEGKQVRYSLTDAIKWYIDNHEVSENKRKWIYHHCSEAANIGLFGRKASKLCIDFGIADNSKLRDALTTDELRWLSQIEDLASRLIIFQGYEPHPAVKEAVNRLALNKVERVA